MSEKALDHFKDWSNYLLIMTVAAMGWVASDKPAISDPCLRSICVLLFGCSAVCGMLTLALIPLVAEQYHRGKPLTDRNGQQVKNKQGQLVLMNSFYDVFAKFNVGKWKWSCRVKYVCFPQHLLFIAGIGCFVIGTYLSPPRSQSPKSDETNPAAAHRSLSPSATKVQPPVAVPKDQPPTAVPKDQKLPKAPGEPSVKK